MIVGLRTPLLVLALALFPLASEASLYKCKDAAGNVAYSDKPCPATGEQEAMRVAADSTELFLARAASLTRNNEVNKPQAVQRALSITFQDGDRGRYFWVNTSPSAAQPATRITLLADGEKNGRGMLTLNFTPYTLCVSQIMINRAFQATFNIGSPRIAGEHDVSEHHQYYYYDYIGDNRARMILKVRYSRARNKDFCAEKIELGQNQ